MRNRAHVARWTIAALVALSSLSACDHEERVNAEVVVAAVGRFRTADLAATPAAVDALKATPCRSADTCAARDACIAAGEALARSLRLKAEVQKGLTAVENGKLSKDSPEAKEMPAKLDEAEAALKKGQEGLPACDEQVRALRRKHRI